MKPPAAAITAAFPEVYLVGGALRDAALGRPFKDLDLAAPPSPDFNKRLKKLAAALDAALFPLDEENGVWRLTGRGPAALQVDIAPFQGGTLEADLRRRDFTVNAMALKLAPDTPLKASPSGAFALKLPRAGVEDPLGGRRDAAARRLKACSAGIFKEDPLRLLRAFRLASELDFKIPPPLAKAVKAHAALIKRSAPERAREELLRLLQSPQSAGWVREMHKAGLLCALIPELAPLEKCAPVYYGKGGALRHTFQVLERMDAFLADLPRWLPEHAKLGPQLPPAPLLKTAALLHDVAKPPKAAEIDGRLRFFGHEEFGAVMAEKILERLRFSRDEIRAVSAIIATHLRPGNLASNYTVSDRALFRLFRGVGRHTPALLALCWADHSSYITTEQLRRFRPRLRLPPAPLPKGLPYNSPKKTLRFMQVLHLLFRAYAERDPNAALPRLADGRDVMKTLGLPAGPRVGEILERLRLLQFEGKVGTREEALKALKGLKA
jgi:poly(A) polymerase